MNIFVYSFGRSLFNGAVKKVCTSPYIGHIVPAEPTLGAVSNFAFVALLWYFQMAMELQKVRAAERRGRADAGPPKVRTLSLAQLCFLRVDVGETFSLGGFAP